MKKIILIALMMVSGMIFAQGEPQLEAVGQLVKATYYYDNGNIQQVGYFKDGKLEGKWTSYTENGTIQAIAEYSNGDKTGKWQFFDNAVAVKEVDYSKNQIAVIKDLNAKPIAVKN
jgi:antitoxin component YwqK of YwqJK toxin-antitoxin module